MTGVSAVVTGFGTIDYVVEPLEQFSGTGTAVLKTLQKTGWPRAGGAALYASHQLRKAGVDAKPITWVGEDAAADQYKAACRKNSISIDGVTWRKGWMTPTCILIYQPDGDYGCLFDPGSCDPRKLSADQQSLLQAADLVIVAVGPPNLVDDIIAQTRPDATVAWIAKTDHVANPPCVRERLAKRADFIFCNGGEREFVDRSFTDQRSNRQVIIETHGGGEVLIDQIGEQVINIPVTPVQTQDTTGAGDTFAGATMTQILLGQSDLKVAVEAGINAAVDLLTSRS
jgi:ribokinase